jgi:hypothetical protein
MPINWINSLNGYNYKVILRNYTYANDYPGFFNFPVINVGNRNNTTAFETYFSNNAATNIEVWIEVLFWKMYSQAGRRNNKTKQVADYLINNNVTSQDLYNACYAYINNDTRNNLNEIRKLLGFKAQVIAIAATFPAFLRPDLFPMVDTRVAKWVGQSMSAHNNANPISPQLVRPPFLNNNNTVLTLADFDFVRSWTQWCRHKAIQLTQLTNIDWRPRDVEMAVFNAWGDKGANHPVISLEIIP